MTEFPEDSPRAHENREAEDWLRRELAFLHGVERRVVRRTRLREEAWRAGAVALIFVMFASCWYLAALSSSGETGTACPVASADAAADSTVPASGSGGTADTGGTAGSGGAGTDASAQYRTAATVHTVAQPGAGSAGGTEPDLGVPAAGAAAPHSNTVKPGGAPRPDGAQSGVEQSGAEQSGAGQSGVEQSAVERSGAQQPGVLHSGASRPGSVRQGAAAHQDSAQRAGARGPGHPRLGGTPRRKAVKPAGAGDGKPADPVKPAAAEPAEAASAACGV